MTARTAKEMTQEEAVKLHDSKFWEEMDFRARTEFQLFQERLCMPFTIFHEAVEKTLNRPVFTHEFAFVENLRKEFLGERPAPSFTEIMNLIPKDKLVLMVVP